MAIAAMIAWVLTASVGAYMLRTWVTRGGLRRQRATGVGVPPAVVFGHASAALTGLLIWLGFIDTGLDLLAWLGVIGLLAAFTFALTWLTVALGLAAKTVESASNTPMFLMLLPFLSSAFVPTDSMPPGLRAFAEYQPFTPITETLRGLFFGTPIGSNGIVSLAWCAGIALVSFLWARKLFSRDPIR